MSPRYLSRIPYANRVMLYCFTPSFFFRIFLALITLAAMTGAVLATMPLYFPGEQDNTIYNSGVPDYSPAVAYDSTLDRHLLVWVSDTGGGCAFGCPANLYGRITDGEGNSLIGPFTISTANDFQLDPAVAYSPTAGEYLVVWQDNRFGDTNNTDFRADIRAKRIRASDGANLGEFLISNQDNDWQRIPRVAYHRSSNRFVVVWEDGATNRIYGRAVASGGGVAGGIQTLSGASGGGFKFSGLTAGPTSEMLAVWSHGGGVRARRVRASDAAPLGGEIFVSSGGGLLANVAYNSLTQEYLLVWEQGGSILAQRYSSGGAALGGTFNPFTFAANRGHPVVAFCPVRSNGTFAVTMYRGGPGSWDLDRQLVDGSGGLIGSTFGATTPAGGEQTANRLSDTCREGTRAGISEWLMHT